MKKFAFVAALLVALCATEAAAQAYPARPIKLIVGFPPGGGADTVARPMAEAMSRLLGQPVVVENRPGAGTTIASDQVARAPADGYTLLMNGASMFGADQFLYKDSVNYGARDFAAITRWTAAPLILAASPSADFRSVPELIAKAKARPGAINYASSGNGVITHIAALYFEQLSGIEMRHIPYKGGALAVQSVVSGDTQLTFGTPPSVMPLAEGGRLRAIAVTSQARSPLFPSLPSIAESGVKGYDFTFWWGLYAPAALPADITAKLFAASLKALEDPKVRASLSASGNEAWPSSSPAEFREWALAEGRKARELAERVKATLD
jgi:tripartite-type tricarboxylate transporter receptor subunit TctC